MTARTVLLVRHAKAKSRDEGLDDLQRPLTKAGRKALEATLVPVAKLAKELVRDATADAPEGVAAVAIWSSEAVRACETAEQVTKRLMKNAEPELRPCLTEQNLERFAADLDASDSPLVIAVGHNPFMERALAELTGCQLALGVGSIAAVQLPAAEQSWSRQLRGSTSIAVAPENRARLLWLVEGVPARPFKVALSVEGTVAKAAKTVAERLQGFLDDPDDVETLHKLRVSIRTLRSLVGFLEPFLEKKQAKGMQRELRGIVLQTSDLREYDVLLEQVETLDTDAGELYSAICELRGQERDTVLEALSGKETARALAAVRKGAEHLTWKERVERAGLAPERLTARFDELADGVTAGLATLDYADEEAVHTLRKDAKRVRYVAENFGALMSPSVAERAHEMAAVQDQLGALCDARVNVQLICGFPAAGLSPEAHRGLGSLLEQNMSFLDSAL